MNWMKKVLPFMMLALSLVVVAYGYQKNTTVKGAQHGFDYDALAKTVVMDDGRAKPLDSVARNTLLILYGKQQLVHVDEDGKKQKVDALPWMMDLIARPQVAHDYKVFRIDHPDLISLLGLTRLDGYDDKFFSYNQILPGRKKIADKLKAMGREDPKNAYERAASELSVKIQRYEGFAGGDRPLVIPPVPGKEGSKWTAFDMKSTGAIDGTTSDLFLLMKIAELTKQNGIEPGEAAAFIEGLVKERKAPESLVARARLFDQILTQPEAYDKETQEFTSRFEDPEYFKAERAFFKEAVPKLNEDPSLWTVMELTKRTADADKQPASAGWLNLVRAYRSGDANAFNAALVLRSKVIKQAEVEAAQKTGLEVLLNRAMPFIQAITLNVIGFLLGLATLYFGRSGKGTWGRSVWWGMMAVLGSALLIQTVGILMRMYIQGRPPVTDLYSSAVLVGWAAVGVCLLIEHLTKRGVAGVVAAICGFGTMIIAHHLSKDGDTMGPMQAVLDSNFWLATHVVIITLGYAATFVAGLMALVYIVMGMATPRLDRPAARQLMQMVYATVCFALLLSFVGTVLGGIWADQSWGRFWGWDPKENGAVLIVMMNAIILHAKWGKLIKERGIMVLAVGGNIVTAWSWFGTNQLGVGLHAYGFTDGVVRALAIFAASQLLVMSLAMTVPTRYWWSFRKPKKRAESR